MTTNPKRGSLRQVLAIMVLAIVVVLIVGTLVGTNSAWKQIVDGVIAGVVVFCLAVLVVQWRLRSKQ